MKTNYTEKSGNKTTKRLVLNKQIISEMNNTEMGHVLGGRTNHTVCDKVTKDYYCTFSLGEVCL